ncbi:MAG: chitin deacetylase [Rhizobiales bacterium 32-66-8]|nr:MAG: chitin deacetylase [Rhizobiales bacterium 32-66-8]
MKTASFLPKSAPAPAAPARDLMGYAGAPPQANWPGGAKVAVSFVVNFEEGAEFTLSEGDATNEGIYEVDHRLDGPDPCIESHFEYGTRAAWWRVMDLLESHGISATVSACGRAVERSPDLARDALKRGHELAAHGWRWESHAGMEEATERARIARTIAAFQTATGTRPVGWHTRSAASANTRRLLVEEGGFLYDSDAYNDDLPYFVPVAGRRHLVLPYAFDTNDMHFQHTQRFRGSDFADYVIDAFDWLVREGDRAPKMMSVGLHLRMIGRPGRMGALDRILRHMAGRSDAWITTRSAIANHWITRVPPPPCEPPR